MKSHFADVWLRMWFRTTNKACRLYAASLCHFWSGRHDLNRCQPAPKADHPHFQSVPSLSTTTGNVLVIIAEQVKESFKSVQRDAPMLTAYSPENGPQITLKKEQMWDMPIVRFGVWHPARRCTRKMAESPPLPSSADKANNESSSVVLRAIADVGSWDAIRALPGAGSNRPELSGAQVQPAIASASVSCPNKDIWVRDAQKISRCHQSIQPIFRIAIIDRVYSKKGIHNS